MLALTTKDCSSRTPVDVHEQVPMGSSWRHQGNKKVYVVGGVIWLSDKDEWGVVLTEDIEPSLAGPMKIAVSYSKFCGNLESDPGTQRFVKV